MTTRPCRAIVAAATLITVTLGLAGCSSGSADPQGLPTRLPPSTPTSPPTSTATTTAPPTTPAWEKKFTPAELTEYKRALIRWTDYERVSKPVWETGKATPAAKRLFQKYFYVWQNQYQLLQAYQASDVKLHGVPTTFWSRGTRIKVGGTEGSAVSFNQCVKYPSGYVTQNGKAVKGGVTTPILRTITLSQPTADDAYLVSRVRDGSAGKVRKCEP